MKMTLRIARLELNNLFAAPLSWILLVGFAIFSAVNVLPKIETAAFNWVLFNRESFLPLTSVIYFGLNGTYLQLTSTIFMFLIPILSMGVISKETSSGTIKVLYSSPVKLRSIVLGKFLALLFFVTALMLIVLAMLVIGALSIDNFDASAMVATWVTLYLYAAMIAALTVWMSTLSAYPVVDAVASIAILYGLKIIYGLVENVPVVHKIFYWLVPERQLHTAMSGLFTNMNIVYFVMLVVLFLLLANWQMVSKRQTLSGKRLVHLKMVGAALASGLVIYLMTLPQFLVFKDMTANQRNILTKESQELLAPLKGQPITITTYTNIFGGGMNGINYPARLDQENRLFQKFRLNFPQLRFEYRFFYDENVINQMKSRGMFPELTPETTIEEALAFASQRSGIPLAEIKSLQDYGVRDNIIETHANQVPVFVISSGSKQMPLTSMFEDNNRAPKEQEIAIAMAGLIDLTVPVAMVSGHEERGYENPMDPLGYNRPFANLYNRAAFINQGFSLSTLTLENQVPTDNEILIIADPKTPYSEVELANYNEYLASGNHLLIMSEPGREDIVNPLLAELGLKQNAGQLENVDPNLESFHTFGQVAKGFNQLYTGQTPVLFTPSVASLEVIGDKGFKVLPILTCDTSTTMYALERNVNGKVQRILVSGDSDMMAQSNLMNIAPGDKGVMNGALNSVVAHYLIGGQFPLDIQMAEMTDLKTMMKYENIKYLKLFAYFLLPGIFLLVGGMMIAGRAKK